MSELCSLETSNVCRTRDTGVKANTEEEETVNRTLREFPISLLSNAFRREHNAFRSPPRDCFPIFIREIGKKIECSKSMRTHFAPNREYFSENRRGYSLDIFPKDDKISLSP